MATLIWAFVVVGLGTLAQALWTRYTGKAIRLPTMIAYNVAGFFVGIWILAPAMKWLVEADWSLFVALLGFAHLPLIVAGFAAVLVGALYIRRLFLDERSRWREVQSELRDTFAAVPPPKHSNCRCTVVEFPAASGPFQRIKLERDPATGDATLTIYGDDAMGRRVTAVEANTRTGLLKINPAVSFDETASSFWKALAAWSARGFLGGEKFKPGSIKDGKIAPASRAVTAAEFRRAVSTLARMRQAKHELVSLHNEYSHGGASNALLIPVLDIIGAYNEAIAALAASIKAHGDEVREQVLKELSK